MEFHHELPIKEHCDRGSPSKMVFLSSWDLKQDNVAEQRVATN